MDGIQEGGVHTQKVSLTIGVIALLMMGAFVCGVFATDDSDADVGTTVDVIASTDYIGINESLTAEDAKKVTYTLVCDKQCYYVVDLVNSSGTSSGSITDKKGDVDVLSDGVYKKDVIVTAPLSSGEYSFTVKFFEDESTSAVGQPFAEKTVPLKVVDPIVLTFTLKNEGSSSVTLTVYFNVNGEKMEDSEQTKTITANSSQDFTYDYYTRDVKDTTYSLGSDDKIINQSIKGLNEEKTFYAHDADYTVITALIVVVLVIMAIVCIFIYRKPVINKGKPKGRR